MPEIADYEQRISYDYGHVNLLKCGVLYADKINAVSPNYASELLTHPGAHGMASIFQQRAADLRGILNGCDYQDWDPAFDDFLPATYDVDNLAGKAHLQAEPATGNRPAGGGSAHLWHGVPADRAEGRSPATAGAGQVSASQGAGGDRRLGRSSSQLSCRLWRNNSRTGSPSSTPMTTGRLIWWKRVPTSS